MIILKQNALKYLLPFGVMFITLLLTFGIIWIVNTYQTDSIAERVTLSGILDPSGQIILNGKTDIKGPVDIIGKLQPDGMFFLEGINSDVLLDGTISLIGNTELKALDYIGVTEDISLVGQISATGEIELIGDLGSQGPQGLIGLTGEIETNGEVGLTGSLGSQGSQGPIGLNSYSGRPPGNYRIDRTDRSTGTGWPQRCSG
jgi:hypothetical protein